MKWCLHLLTVTHWNSSLVQCDVHCMHMKPPQADMELASSTPHTPNHVASYLASLQDHPSWCHCMHMKPPQADMELASSLQTTLCCQLGTSIKGKQREQYHNRVQPLRFLSRTSSSLSSSINNATLDSNSSPVLLCSSIKRYAMVVNYNVIYTVKPVLCNYLY